MENSLMITKTDVEKVPTVTLEQLPSEIANTFNSVRDISGKIKEANDKAKISKGDADIAASKSAGWSIGGKDKKEAIESLQTAVVSMSKAQESHIEATQQLFENQTKMTEAIRFLFGLGVTSIAANRTVVRELELQLRNASEEELSDLARQEITTVILQLRAQEDMQKKLDNHDEILREHRDELQGFKKAFTERIEELKNTTDKLCERIDNTNKSVENNSRENQENLQSVEKAITDLSEEFNKTIDKVNSELIERIDSSNKWVEDISKNFTKKINSDIVPRIADLETYKKTTEERRTFLDSKLYKVIVGMTAIAALICSIIL